jgi:hypothetical protein
MEWRLKPDEIGDLHLMLPDAASGEARLTIELIAPGGNILADASTVLKVMAPPPSNDLASAIETELRAAYIFDQLVQELDARAEESSAAPDAATLESEAVPLPTRRPAPPRNDDGQANWVKPSAYVNLREAPSSSSAVVGVVAKGTKLSVMGRMRGWVQVNNPTTSQSGWIYSGNVETLR